MTAISAFPVAFLVYAILSPSPDQLGSNSPAMGLFVSEASPEPSGFTTKISLSDPSKPLKAISPLAPGKVAAGATGRR